MKTIVIDDIKRIQNIEPKFPRDFILKSFRMLFEDFCIEVKGIYFGTIRIDYYGMSEYITSINIPMVIINGNSVYKIDAELNSDGYFYGVNIIESNKKSKKASGRCEYPIEIMLKACNYIMTTSAETVKNDNNEYEYDCKTIYSLDEIIALKCEKKRILKE